MIEFAPPAPLMNMNQRVSWRTRHRLTKAWRSAACVAAVDELGAPSARVRQACTVAITLPVPDARRRDPHNYFATVKPIIDGLVDAGIWPDDTPEWVTTTEPTLEVRRPFPIVTVVLRPRAGRPA